MRAPKRTPWGSKAEFAELYEMLFSPMADISSHKRGLSRMSLYISAPSCPTFIHLLDALITADILPNPPMSPEEANSTRMTCAMAVVRFVNGMVDPLQTGPYARPISHLAATLGIPPSLIALRHRATHEDLPPLPLLRQAVQSAIEYIHYHSFLPLLATGSNQPKPDAGKSEVLVRRWKSVMKVRMREKDVGEENDTGREVRRLKSDLEGKDGQEVVEALCKVGGLVPVARKKRPAFGSVELSSASLQLWTPLLSHFATSNPSLPNVMAETILAALIRSAQLADTHLSGSSAEAREAQKEATSFRWSLAVWFIYLWRGDEQSLYGLALDEEEKRRLWRRLLGSLLQGDPILHRLSQMIADIDPSLEQISISGLLTKPELPGEDELIGLEDGSPREPEEMGVDDKLLAMEQRLLELLLELEANVPKEIRRSAEGTIHSSNDPKGWRQLSNKEWRACPIGCWGTL